MRVLKNFPLATLRDFIDWTPFFHTWGLKGVYPRILDHEEQGAQARQIFAEANALLDTIIKKNLITAQGVYGFFPASAVGDDVELYSDATRENVLERFHFLRQQSDRDGNEPCRSLSDFIAPRETGLSDHIGAFAVTSGIGLKELCDRFRAENDDYNAIMAEALADRLAEAFAECLHKRVRDEWGYGSRREPEQRRSDSGEVSRHPACCGLSGMPGPHREGPSVASARCTGQYRNADYGIICDVARIEREWALFRPSAVTLLQPRQNRPRSGG